MAYDRYDTRGAPRDEHSRWPDDRNSVRGRRDERGFFERAGDEVASWFGDEEAERRRSEDERMAERERGWRPEEQRGRFVGRERDFGRGRPERDEVQYRSTGWTGRESETGYRPIAGDYGRGSDQFFAASGYGRENYDRGPFSRVSYRGYGGEGAYRPSMWGTDASEPPGVERGYRPLIGGYTESEGQNAPAGYPRETRPGDWKGEEFHGGRFATRYDPHYEAWRRRHMSEIDRDYEDYHRENQARFESEFGSWRERRQHKRALLGQIREHMEVIGNDGGHVGTIDRVAGDRIILTKSDPESGGVHHSLSCADIDRVEDDRVILDLKTEDAKQRWRDESRERALFEREDQGEMGPRTLGRSFEGTYR